MIYNIFRSLYLTVGHMKKYDPPEQLLKEFDSSIRVELVPFMKNNGMRHTVGSSDYETPLPVLQSKKYSEMADRFFSWVNRFENDRVVIEVSYGDREFIVEIRVFCLKAQEWFGAWEILAAANSSNISEASGEQFVSNLDFMRRTIIQLSDGIKNNWKALSQCNDLIIRRALELRKERYLSDKAEREKQDMERYCIQASKAFHSKNYQEAIRLLEPYKNNSMLPKASIKLLALARKHS